MSRTPLRQSDPGVLAVLHLAGAGWHVLIADTRAGRPEVTATRDFAASEAEAIGPWVDEHRADEAIVVLPAASVICRTCPLPDARLCLVTSGAGVPTSALILERE